ncbi:Light-harvesting complex [Amphidinium carterae]
MAPAQSRSTRVASATGAAVLLSTAAITQREAFTAGASSATSAQARQVVLRGSKPAGSAPSLGDGSAALSLGSALAVVASGLLGARTLQTRDVRKAVVAAAATMNAEQPSAPSPFDPAAQLGAVEPLGYFDPLGFTQLGDERGFNKLRAAEIKHGRVAMMASIGAIGQPFLKLPWFDAVTGTYGALGSGRATFGMFVLFVACGAFELAWREQEGKEPGNFGDPFGVNMYTEEMRNKELNNGRMAMISVLGIFAAELATGKNAIDQLTLFAEAAPSAPSPFDPAAQLGAVEPLGYFDPLGFTQLGDERGFNKLRAAEIKHGRVAMMASIGAIGQPFLKLPWFDAVTGTYGALGSGRATFGMFVLFVACGAFELAWREQEGKEPGNFGDPFGVNMYTEEMRNKELNNGRMAMISVLGIFAAELATGKNAIDQLTLFAEAAPSAPSPFDPAAQLGAVEPLGYFDPLGFTQLGDERGFNKLRAAEIKHGRVAMMASIGAIGQPFLKLPWFDAVTGTYGALGSGRATFGMFVLFVACGAFELAWREQEGKEPGNFGDPFGVNMYTEEMRNKELNNGRMAMISVLGIFAAELATGKNAIDQLTLFAEAAPSAPSPFDPAAQLGAVEPLGYFDPLGFTQLGDERGFNKLRAAEIKHGRVAMMASIGAIGQPFLKLPWFDAVTGTYGALGSGRATFGMFVLFVACGAFELAWREQEGKEPGNFGDPFGVNMYTEEMRNKELNNGRMAMISVLGIFAAELATGKNAIEQFGF